MAMLYGKHNHEAEEYLEPVFGAPSEQHDLPKYRLPKHSLSPREADRLVRDELLDEGNSRLNLATFCQTYMEPEAVELMKIRWLRMPSTNLSTPARPRLKIGV